MKRNTLNTLLSALAVGAVLAGCSGRSILLRSTVPPPDYDVVVVGSGLGGLSAATHLAVHGFRVLLLEQHYKIGGCTSTFARGDFRFETALHQMNGGLPGSALGNTLIEAGIADDIELIRVREVGRVIYPGLDITLPMEMEGLIDALIHEWPEEEQGIIAYFDLMKTFNAELSELRGLYRKGPVGYHLALLATAFLQPHVFKYRDASIQDILDEFFRDPHLKAAVSQFWLYYGPPPSENWGPFFMMASHSYLHDGAWQIKGSSFALAQAYAQRIKELGGEIEVGVRVTGIDVDEGRVRAVRTDDGRTITAPIVVSNADPLQTVFTLVGEKHFPRSYVEKIQNMRPSTSLAGLYLGLDTTPAQWNISDYEIFLNSSTDNDAMYKAMLSGDYENGVVVITYYSQLNDDWYAPEGKSVMVMHVYSSIDNWSTEPTAYARQKQALADFLLGKAEELMPGLRDHIETAEIVTPLTIQRYTLHHRGTPYGWAFTPEQRNLLDNRTPVSGLYFSGSWTKPGHGVGTVQISGYNTARLIMDDLGMD